MNTDDVTQLSQPFKKRLITGQLGGRRCFLVAEALFLTIQMFALIENVVFENLTESDFEFTKNVHTTSPPVTAQKLQNMKNFFIAHSSASPFKSSEFQIKSVFRSAS